MKLISFFVRRPIATSMILFIFLFFGIMGLIKMPVDLFPNISHPQLSIITTQENSSSEEIEKFTTKPLEEQLSFLKNLSYISSKSEEGASRIQLFFRWGTNMDFAALETREKIDVIKSDLPEKSTDPVIQRFNPNAQPVLAINIISDQPTTTIRQMAESKIKPALERMRGIAQVRVFGGEEEEIQVILNPHKLKAHHITLQEVIDNIAAENISARGGTLQEGNTDLLIHVSGEFQALEDIENAIVAKRNNVPIYIKSLGTVKKVHRPKSDHSFLNGTPSVSLEVYKEPAGNTLTITKQFNELKPSLEKETGSTLHTTYDQSHYIDDSLSMLKGNALLGAILTTLILFIFLKSFASTLVVILAIPFSVICSFFLLYSFGISLNIFSIAGIALALGMVVDSSIVILENIYEHLRQEEGTKSATINATVEVSGAVIASILTTLAVFIPILFVKGPIGFIFRDLSLSIIFGLIFSLIISFSFIPMIAAQIISVQKKPRDIDETMAYWKKIILQGLIILDGIYLLGTKARNLYERILRYFTLTPKTVYEEAVKQTKVGQQKFEKIQKTVESGYERTLKEAIQSWTSRLSVISVVFVIFFISLFFIPKTEFLPQSIQHHYKVTLSHPVGTSLSHMKQVALDFDASLQKEPNIGTTQLNVSGTKSHTIITFKDKRTVERDLENINQMIQRIPDTQSHVEALTPLKSITAGMDSRTVDLKLKGPNLTILKQKAALFQEWLSTLNDVQEASAHIDAGQPEMRIEIDRTRSADFSLTAEAISNNLKNQLYGIHASNLHSSSKHLPIMVRTQRGKLDTSQKLADLLIPSPLGVHIPLQSIAQFKEGFSPSTLYREEKEQTISLFARLKPKRSPKDLIETIEAAGPEIKQKLSLSHGYSIHIGPLIKTMIKSFSNMTIALIVALILIYMIMAAQFESFMHPFTILFSVPLSLIGVTASLVLTGKLLSLPAFIGIIILTGIVVNNSIILIDYINILRRRGLDREDAILQAGKRRLRPILMTSITTAIGMIPLALGIGAGSELYQPLAIVMVGGMISSTFLTLLFIPTIYCFFDDLNDIIGLLILRLQVRLSTDQTRED